MKGDKYPGQVKVKIKRVDDWSPETLLKYMEECRKILAQPPKGKPA